MVTASAVVAPPVTPALYDVVVSHTRRTPFTRSFEHKTYLWLVDLDHLPDLPKPLRPFARFEARDHLGDPTKSIKRNLHDWLARQGVHLPGGRTVMLANARVLGHVFNPITVYWCFRAEGGLECMVAEVHNTYRGRHCYLLRPDDDLRAEVDKEFYVSPFLEMGGHYVMRLPRPGPMLSMTIALRQHGSTPFTATLRGSRTSASTRDLVRMLCRRPLVTQRVSALIRAHGIALWLRRLPVVRRPHHEPQEGVQ